MSKHNVVVVERAGISWVSILGIVFITLKLIGIIQWSWLWVLAPLWIPIAASVLFAFVFCSLCVLVAMSK